MYENYRPVPIDTSGIVMNEELLELIERLALNQHELFAKEFLDAGWQFGDTCSVQNRTHPMLMPYQELTDEQRARYHKTVSAVVSALLALGYNISK